MLENNIHVSGMQKKVPEYMMKQANAHIKNLMHWETEFAKVTAEDAADLYSTHDDAVLAAVAADKLAGNLETTLGIAESMS